MINEKLALVGKITGFHGVKGELKVFPLTNNRDRFYELNRVFLAKEDKSKNLFTDYKVHIENVFYHKGNIIVKLKEFKSRDEVKNLKGYFISILKSERPALPEGEYYYDEIIGLEVFNENGDYLGTITEINETGSNDVYIVREGENEFLLPALKQVVKEIDLENGKMKVELMNGLVD